MNKAVWRDAFDLVEGLLPRLTMMHTVDEEAEAFAGALPLYVQIAQQGKVEREFAAALWSFLGDVAKQSRREAG